MVSIIYLGGVQPSCRGRGARVYGVQKLPQRPPSDNPASSIFGGENSSDCCTLLLQVSRPSGPVRLAASLLGYRWEGGQRYQ